MPLRISKGQMFSWVTHTWNPIFGQCSHKCAYCYMRRHPLPALHLKSRELLTDLGSDRTIFVGSATDMFADDVKSDWIRVVLQHCRKHDGNTYLFQTKNPRRYLFFTGEWPAHTIFGTTIETNRAYADSRAPSVFDRAACLRSLGRYASRTVTIEPIMDFDFADMMFLLRLAAPEFVSIGADSKGHGLQEPSWDKVQQMVRALEQFTEIRVKHNLERLHGKKNS